MWVVLFESISSECGAKSLHLLGWVNVNGAVWFPAAVRGPTFDKATRRDFIDVLVVFARVDRYTVLAESPSRPAMLPSVCRSCARIAPCRRLHVDRFLRSAFVVSRTDQLVPFARLQLVFSFAC